MKIYVTEQYLRRNNCERHISIEEALVAKSPSARAGVTLVMKLRNAETKELTQEEDIIQWSSNRKLKPLEVCFIALQDLYL